LRVRLGPRSRRRLLVVEPERRARRRWGVVERSIIERRDVFERIVQRRLHLFVEQRLVERRVDFEQRVIERSAVVLGLLEQRVVEWQLQRVIVLG
jgi:hypothetical protein